MALVTTTLSSAATATAGTIVLASASSVAAGRLIRVDQEMMQVVQSYVSGTTVGVLRGRGGSAAKAHVVTVNVVHGTAADFDNPPDQSVVGYEVGRKVVITSVTATSTLTHAPAGSDHRVILNGTSVIALTVPIPTADMDGDMLVIISNGAAAHTPTFTGGLGGASTSYDVITNNATGQMALVVFAANGAWCIPQAPALTGTVTNITGGIA